MDDESWILGVDESGRMKGADGLVAGVLVRLDDTPANVGALREALLDLMPGIPWPLHATHLRRPTTHALGWLAPSPQRASRFPEDFDRCALALELLQRSEHPTLLRAVDAARGGMWSRIEFGAADRAFRDEAPAAHRQLRPLVTDRFVRLSSWLAALTQRHRADGCFGVIAAGPDDGALGVPVPGGVGTDRYLALLEVLFERLLMLRCAPTLRRTLHVRVATRHIEEHLGARRGFPLRSTDWLKLFERAAANVERCHGARVRRPRILAPQIVTKYDATAHPVVVIADLLANSTLALARARVSWRTLREHVTRASGLPLATVAEAVEGQPTLPAVAAAGSFRAAIRAAFEGGTPVPIEEEPQWAADQASEWIAAAGAKP